MFLPKGAIRYAYYSEDLDETKFLTIGGNSSKEDKWKSYNIPTNYLWYYYQYIDNSCNNLIVSKSIKDCLILRLLNRCSIAVQNESSKTLLSNKDKINKIGNKIWINFGSDKQGKNNLYLLLKKLDGIG